jgi:Ca2+-binding RTX toxin-like protein
VIIGGRGDDNITGGNGADTFIYTSTLDGHDIISGFDADPAGGQDFLSLDWLFDGLAIATADRAARVQVTDRGLAVDVKVDADGDGTFELFAVTVSTASTLVKGDDIVMGTL